MNAPLLDRIQATSRRAANSGALQPIATTCQTLREGNATFVARVLGNVRRKQEAKRTVDAHETPADPFSDYEPDLYVGDAAPAHRVLLNKFNVIEDHALLVTRAFEPQTAPLTLGDIQAALACLAEYDGLLFYNGGAPAGASQPHKHLQLVPRSLGPHGIPMEPQIRAALTNANALKFPHAADGVSVGGPPQKQAAEWHARYCDQLERIGRDSSAARVAPYNWLATRDWMLAVPRTHGKVEGIAINALAFAGAFLVKDQAQLEDLERYGAQRLLADCTG